MIKKEFLLNPIHTLIFALLFMGGCCSKDYFGTCTDDGASGETPVAEEPVAEEPVAEEPVAEEPVLSFCENLTEQFNNMSPESVVAIFNDSIFEHGADLKNCDNEGKTFELHLSDAGKSAMNDFLRGSANRPCGKGDLIIYIEFLSYESEYTSSDGTLDNLVLSSQALEVQYEDQYGTTTLDTIKIVTTSEEIIVGTQVMDFVSRNSELVSLQTEVEGICDETTGEALGELEDFFNEIAGNENDFNVGGAYLIFWMP